MLCFVFAALVVLLDQFFKRWIERSLNLFESMELIPGVINLTHIQNTGAAFSILAGQRWLLAGIAFIASLLLVFILLRYTDGFWGTLGLSAVLGGAIGNLIDRVFYGYVVDMFRTEFIDFAVFNIADIFITLGFATFCVHLIVITIKSPKGDDRDLKSVSHEDEYQEDAYEYPEELGEPDYDDYSDTRVLPAEVPDPHFELEEGFFEEEEYRTPEKSTSHIIYPEVQEHIEPVSWQDYYEPVPEAPPEVISSLEAISALDALESELDIGEDYDVDKLLREYGFEDD